MTLPHPLRPGLYDSVVDRRLRQLLEALGPDVTADEDSLDPADVPDRLSRLFADALNAGLAGMSKPEQRLELVRELRNVLARTDGLLSSGELELNDTTPNRLLEIRPSRDDLALTQPTKRPTTPLADSALLMNAPGEPALAQELQAELASADRVDLLIAFVKWSGIRLVEDALKELIQDRGGRVRVLTTTYTGASDANALAALARWGADVRIREQVEGDFPYLPAGIVVQLFAEALVLRVRLLRRQGRVEGGVWDGRAQFLAFCSKAMRRILIDYARRRSAAKRGGARVRVPLTDDAAVVEAEVTRMLDIDEALRQLEQHDERMGRIVECRFFGGMSVADTAEAVGASTRTVERDWARARAYLHEALQ